MQMETDKKKTEFWKAEAVAFLALQSIKGVGFKTLYKLVQSATSLKDFLKHSSAEEFSKVLRISLGAHVLEDENSWQKFQLDLWSHGLKLLKELKLHKVKLVFKEQEEFPKSFHKMDNPPQWLFIQGNLENLNRTAVAIVGSRKCSPDGYWLSKYIHALLKDLSVITVSGLAEGIDQSVHQESLQYHIPTVAILGTGIDSNFPRGSENLRNQIISHGGTVITEYLLGQSYSSESFVQRNRLQAALSSCLIPLEWKIKSGTAHTVNFAKRYNKPIVMLHLPLAVKACEEIEAINEYENGATFEVPSHTSPLMEHLINIFNNEENNKSSSDDSSNIKMREQYQLDLEG